MLQTMANRAMLVNCSLIRECVTEAFLETGFIVSLETELKENVQFSSFKCRKYNQAYIPTIDEC